MNAFAEKPNENMDITNPSSWPLWLDLSEVAQILRLSVSTIGFLHRSGKLKARKFGKQLRFHKDVVAGFAG